MSDDIYVAATSGTIHLDDGTVVQLQQGITRVRAGHPLLDGRESMFRLLDVHYDVEQATARPSEKRGPGRPPGGKQGP